MVTKDDSQISVQEKHCEDWRRLVRLYKTCDVTWASGAKNPETLATQAAALQSWSDQMQMAN